MVVGAQASLWLPCCRPHLIRCLISSPCAIACCLGLKHGQQTLLPVPGCDPGLCTGRAAQQIWMWICVALIMHSPPCFTLKTWLHFPLCFSPNMAAPLSMPHTRSWLHSSPCVTLVFGCTPLHASHSSHSFLAALPSMPPSKLGCTPLHASPLNLSAGHLSCHL